MYDNNTCCHSYQNRTDSVGWTGKLLIRIPDWTASVLSPPHRQSSASPSSSALPVLCVAFFLPAADCCPPSPSFQMDPEASRSARESLELAFQMSNILDTGLDRHTLSVLIALCDLGVNPEALAALVKELRNEKPSLPSETAPSSSS
ncbi:hypothetical protein PIB30_074989 [Stylosanthes scabra]|uniref:Mitotic-spindle organizing protein 1 n=1 Tax=Stylosanthes scabra TaxID=79078 RepID=A0ABU6QR19_9FABA|nr:hypothetical protein [Stylosanthes scabra]